jgi:hypothetical protein
MQVRALRGVCIGVERHLKPGDTADLPAAEVQFLTGIRAVELVPDAPKVDPETVTPAKPAPKGK